MQNTPFTTNTFKGRSGYLSGIVRDFAAEHLEHYHVTMYQGNTALQYWAEQAILESGKPVLIVNRKNSHAMLASASDFPGNGVPYKIKGDKLFVHLGLLPPRYEHENAVGGGLGESEEFMKPYQSLSTSLAIDAEREGFNHVREVEQLLQDPSIISGAMLSVFPEQPTWKHIVWYGMHQGGMWDESFRRLSYSEGDNCIEGFPKGFEYPLLIPVIEEFGGWVDFMPGIRESSQRRRMTCNFTTTGMDGKGLAAIVQSADMTDYQIPLTPGQKRFMEAVFDAFGVIAEARGNQV